MLLFVMFSSYCQCVKQAVSPIHILGECVIFRCLQ